MRKNKAY